MKTGIAVVVVLLIMLNLGGCNTVEQSAVDPNDDIYKFLLKPPSSWTDKHGSDERSVMIFNVSAASALAQGALKETRALAKKVDTIHDPSVWADPNEVTQ